MENNKKGEKDWNDFEKSLEVDKIVLNFKKTWRNLAKQTFYPKLIKQSKSYYLNLKHKTTNKMPF